MKKQYIHIHKYLKNKDTYIQSNSMEQRKTVMKNIENIVGYGFLR